MAEFGNDFRDMMSDTITFKKSTSVDKYGKRTMGAASSPIICRVLTKPTMVRTEAGEEKVSSTTVWLDGVYGVEPEDEVTLPNGKKPKVMTVERYTDETGPAYEKVMLT